VAVGVSIDDDGLVGSFVDCSSRTCTLVIEVHNEFLNLADVQVSRLGENIDNLSAALSSEIKSSGIVRTANYCVDGDPDTYCHSNTEENARLSIDISGHIIDTVIVINRLDCCQDRLNGASIFILEDSKQLLWSDQFDYDSSPAYVFYQISPTSTPTSLLQLVSLLALMLVQNSMDEKSVEL
jgi:hypothetical protein